VPYQGPPIQLVATSVDATRTSPSDADIVLSFDRLLNPFTVTRQSVALRDAFGQAPSSPLIIYDPVARTVTVKNPAPGQPFLLENQPYKIILGVPQTESDVSGLRAIDGATLAAPIVFGFLTTPGAGPTSPAPVSFCNQVLPVLQTHCAAAGGCHAPQADDEAGPRMGLVWTSAAGVQSTAIGRVASESNTGATMGTGLPAGRLFAVDMPLVDPGNPGNSYVIYKLLSRGEPGAPATTAPALHVPLASDEVDRLRYFIHGQPMPLSGTPLSYDDTELVRAWIAQGASTAGCN